jgi:trehalose 6-phosphate synthase/phosphatase
MTAVNRIVIVSNRLPVTVSRTDDGLDLAPSVGGLATGLSSFYKEYESLWIGWPGVPAEDLDRDEAAELERRLADEHGCKAVHLRSEDLSAYYEGFSNSTIWPLFHYFTQYTTYAEEYWRSYVEVNRAFADALIEEARPGDHIWVHDYHLMLLPEMVRQRVDDATIGFFLHIPFPSFETFRQLPWRLEIMSGLLGCDLVGFHTYDYAKHFLVSVRNLLGHEHAAGEIRAGRRVIKVDSFPMGIDYERYRSGPGTVEVRASAARVRQQMQDRKLVLSVDRLDYSKGILERITAFETFLDLHPEYHDRVQVVVVAVPSRTGVAEYEQLKRSVDEAVGRVNGRFGTIGWNPIEYLYTSLDFPDLVALYDVADVCLVTPLRDGMNLIAKEYLAANTRGRGVLVLSEMAGAAKELGEALIVNPNNRVEVANAIRSALEMPDAQREQRSAAMRERLKRYDVSTWAADFMHSLEKARERRVQLQARSLSRDARHDLGEAYRAAESRVLFLDYDGTMVRFAKCPAAAVPDDDLLDLLKTLVADPANRVVVISGRDRGSLESWLASTGVDLSAEHGAFVRPAEGEWEPMIVDDGSWKEPFRAMLDQFVVRTPGSFVEEKEFSLVWHYRQADAELAAIRSRELKDAAINLSANLDVAVTEDTKVVEVRNSRINEGETAARWLADDPGFVLAVGDDWTDEDLFAAMPDSAYSIKVGFGPSCAAWALESVESVRELLRDLAG